MRNNIGETVTLGNMLTIETASKKTYDLPNLQQKERDFLAPLILQSLKQNVFFDEEATNKMLESELYAISKGLGKVQRVK